MKKLIAVLAIMMILVCAIFADTTSSELKITLTITSVEPTFTLYGSKTSSTASTGAGMTAGAVVASKNTSTTTVALDEDAIINGDTYLYCVVKQSNSGVKSTTTYKLTAEATALTDGTGTAGHYTAAPTVSDITAISASNVTDGRTITTGTAATGATVAYAGATCAAADLASFNVNWPQTDLVPGITYSAYVTLIIATN